MEGGPRSVQGPVEGRRAHGSGVEGQREGEGRQQRLGSQLKFLQLGLLQSLGLGPAVLKPDLHLRLRQAKRVGELGPLRDGQVLFLSELPLQGEQLRGREGSSGFPVVLVLAQVARRRTREPWRSIFEKGGGGCTIRT